MLYKMTVNDFGQILNDNQYTLHFKANLWFCLPLLTHIEQDLVMVKEA